MQLFKKKIYRAVIFDFDGTIVDTHDLAIQSAIKVCVSFAKIEIHEIEEILPKLKKMTSKEILKHFNIKKTDMHKFVEEIRAEMLTKIDEIKPFEGVVEQLTILKEDNIKIGILTSNSIEMVKEFCKLNGVENLFDFIYAEKQFFGKHRALKKIVRKEKLNENHVIYVGDETRDIKAAKKAGIKAVAVSWGFNKKHRLEETNPDLIIDKIEDFKLLKNLI